MKELKYRLFIPFTNNMPLFTQALASVKNIPTTVINNSGSKLNLSPEIEVVDMPVRLEFTQVMNYIRKRSEEYDFILFMHGDGEVTSPEVIKKLIIEASSRPRLSWGVIFTLYDVFCAFNSIALKIVGDFDVLFSQYCADSVYYNQLRLYGFEVVEIVSAGVVHNNDTSTTVKTDFHYRWIVTQKQRFTDHYYTNYESIKYDYANFIILSLKNTKEYKLLTSLFSDSEGNLLEISSGNTTLSQVLILINLLRSLKPKTIIETGTNKGLFALLVKYILPDFVKLYTHDMHKESAEVPKILGEWVTFIPGDTRKTMNELSVEDVDFAWIDGGHDRDVFETDILNCDRLKVKVIAMDDCKTMPFVTEVLNKYTSYTEIKNPYYDKDDRGIRIYIHKNLYE